MLADKIAIDFGTDSIKYCMNGSKKIFREPSIIAVDSYTGRILAYGDKALQIEGRTGENIHTERLIRRDGSIVNFAYAEYVLTQIADRICKNSIFKPVIGTGMSCNITGLDRKSMLDLLYAAGASKAYIIEEPVAAAFGAGIVNDKPKGYAVLDIGAGSTDCAVVTMNSIAVSDSIQVAGNSMTDELVSYLKAERGVEIGTGSAEQAKKILANAVMRSEEIAIVVGGKKTSGEAVNFEVTTTEMRFILKNCFESINELVISVFDKTSPDLLGDIAENGLILAGGCAGIYGISDFLQRNLSIPVTIADNPELSVAAGIKRVLKKAKKLEKAGFLYTE